MRTEKRKKEGSGILMSQHFFRRTVTPAVFVIGLFLLHVTQLPAESHSISIRGLHPTYDGTADVTVVLQSVCADRIEVNVAVEQLRDGHWTEVLASITDRKHPYGKTVGLTPIESGASLPVSFRPFQEHSGVSPLRRSPLPLSLRLRVDLYGPHGGKITDTLWSSVFQVSK